MITSIIAIATLSLSPSLDDDTPKPAFHKSKPGFRSMKVKPATTNSTHMPDSPNEAAAFYFGQRLSADGTMPDNAIMLAKGQRDAILQTDGAGVFPGAWTWLGPGNVGGRLRAIIIHPTQHSIMWVGAVGGGIWKTTNGGASWTPQDDFMAAIGVNSMAIDKTNPDVLYAGTGEGFFNTGIPGSSNNAFKRGAGIFKTFDGGLTWNQLLSTNSVDFHFVNRIAISPVNPNHLLVATNTGIFRSLNAGGFWTMVSAGKTYDVRFHPTDGALAVSGRSDGKPQFSVDSGASWTNATGTAGARVEVAYARSSPNIVYAAISSGGRIKVWQSTNGGQSYALKTSGSGIGTYVNYNSVLWVDPTLPSRLVIGGVELYRSVDSGVNLNNTFNSIHPDHHVIVEHPAFNGSNNRVVFFGHDGGISRTNDVTGGSSVDLNNNLGVTQFYGGAMNANGRMIAGAQDNGTQLYTGNVQGWQHVLGGDGINCESDQTDPNYFYAGYQHGALQRSSDGGQNFFSGIEPPGGGGDDYNFVTHFILDPNLQTRMFVAGRRIYRANNVKTGSPNWIMIKDVIGPDSADPPARDHFEAVPLLNGATVAVAEGNPDIVWVGYNNGQVWKTANGTSNTPTWTRVDENTSALPDRFVSDIMIDRTNHNRVYVSFMGWTSDNVWRTTNAGNNWEQITGTGVHAIPSAPVGAFAVHRTKPGWLYAGTDIGLFTSSDDGASWTTYTDGPGTVPMAEMLWHDDNTLVAITHGRGVFSAVIDPNQQPVGARSFTMLRGTAINSSLDDIARSDNLYLTMRPGIVFSNNLPPIEVQVDATAPIQTIAGLKYLVESNGSSTTVAQTMSLFNFSTGQYEQVDVRNLTTGDASVEITATGNANRFIQAGSRALRAKLSYKLTGPVFTFPWMVKVDFVKWTLTP